MQPELTPQAPHRGGGGAGPHARHAQLACSARQRETQALSTSVHRAVEHLGERHTLLCVVVAHRHAPGAPRQRRHLVLVGVRVAPGGDVVATPGALTLHHRQPGRALLRKRLLAGAALIGGAVARLALEAVAANLMDFHQLVSALLKTPGAVALLVERREKRRVPRLHHFAAAEAEVLAAIRVAARKPAHGVGGASGEGGLSHMVIDAWERVRLAAIAPVPAATHHSALHQGVHCVGQTPRAEGVGALGGFLRNFVHYGPRELAAFLLHRQQFNLHMWVCKG
mmetsp:Transcript_14393/g.27664  ORF Transcript_14393/g.27664 Transcript_14393/m.27664 type:complete len:282 (+) Transcript_14393:1687-2532(+)